MGKRIGALNQGLAKFDAADVLTNIQKLTFGFNRSNSSTYIFCRGSMLSLVVKEYPLLSHHPRMKTKLQSEIGLLQESLEGIEKVYNSGVIDGFDKTCGSWPAHIRTHFNLVL